MQIQAILTQIDLGAIALPEFQRGYVWNREQVRGLMWSLYKKHPVGGLLVWVTKTESAPARGDGPLAPGSVRLLLDGQQRISTLYGIIRGRPPQFFDGNAEAFTNLYFNLDEESFEFFAPLRMKDNPLWINVTELMQVGIAPFTQRLVAIPELLPSLNAYINRLNAVDTIKDINLHIEEVSGEDKTVDAVVDIFDRVNSGGTKLSKGDLALAKVCAEWPEARHELKQRLAKWRMQGFDFRLEWLLRVVNAIVTGEALFSALKDVDPPAVRDGLFRAEHAVDYLLNLIAARLGLDHDRVLGSRYSFPLLARYLSQRGPHLPTTEESDTLLFWYIHTLLWGRYAGSTETVLNQDLAFIERHDGALYRLIAGLRQSRGDLRLQPDDFHGWSQGARFYPLLYMLTCVWHARDWCSGIELSSHLLGHLSKLEVHHIFPRALLYKHGFGKAEVNALANFTFLTQHCNLQVSDKDPSVYLETFAAKHPGAVESHWIPMDRALWKVENYLDFLAARRRLLAQAANDFLDSLYVTAMPAETVPVLRPVPTPVVVPGQVETVEEEQVVLECNVWVVAQGLPEGEFNFELVEPDTGRPLAILDLAWPDGLQPELSGPVALLLNEGQATEVAANQAGYRYFTDVDSFRAYVERDILSVTTSAA